LTLAHDILSSRRIGQEKGKGHIRTAIVEEKPWTQEEKALDPCECGETGKSPGKTTSKAVETNTPSATE